MLAPTLALGQGCATTTVTGPEGQTEAVYKFGKLRAEESKDISTVYQAVVKALIELEPQPENGKSRTTVNKKQNIVFFIF